MHVFLTGASGYIGSAVADRLRAAGHVVSDSHAAIPLPAGSRQQAPAGPMSSLTSSMGSYLKKG
jgi:NAD(P)-dependent dehydrogenase (short-subunit alcohol dehydrogenase family)